MGDKNNSASVNQGINTNPMMESSCKAVKIDDQKVLTPDLQQTQNSNQGFSLLSLSQSIDNKMSNIAKLRQQFVEEVKSIELSQKESIKNLKQKIVDTNKKVEILTTKLKEANEFLCNQSEIIYKKEEENKILRDKVAELFGYQKILYENMEDISNILTTHENFSNNLADEYDQVMLTQDNDITTLEEKLRKLNPDEKLLAELSELNLKINELDREIIEYEGKSTRIESELQEIRMVKENEQNLIGELDKKISELESTKTSMTKSASQEKNKLLNDLQKIDLEISNYVSKSKELELQDNELKQKLEMNKGKELEITEQITEANNTLNALLIESKNLDEANSQNEQENITKIDNLKEELKTKKIQLSNSKKDHIQATNILQNKISELQKKLRSHDNIEAKLQKTEAEISKEEELLSLAIKNSDEKKKELTDKIKLIKEKINDNKLKSNKMERDMSEAEGKIQALEKEIRENNEKYEIKLKASEKNARKSLSSPTFNQHGLPNPLMSESVGKVDKDKNRKKLYTPFLADNDLDIDSLTLEEQVTHLTQAPTSSPEKARKFFKHANLSQPKAKKETISRGKGRGKKY